MQITKDASASNASKARAKTEERKLENKTKREKTKRREQEAIKAERAARVKAEAGLAKLKDEARHGAAVDDDEPSCVICLDQRPVMLVVPCGHRCLCEADGKKIMRESKGERICPICRGPIQKLQRVFD